MSNKVIEIQTKLRAPKDIKNDFGGFNYRSCEDILKAVKPILKEHDCFITLSDTVELMGDRFYVKALARLYKGNGEVLTETSAYARETESRPKFDGAQLTGSASSYARKYALSGLLAIDDSKNDPDSRDNLEEKDYPQTEAEVKADLPKNKTPVSVKEIDFKKLKETAPLRKKVAELLKELGKKEEDACKFVGSKFVKIDGLSVAQLEKLFEYLKSQKKKKAETDPINEDVPMAHVDDLIKKLPKGSLGAVEAYLKKLHWIEQNQTISSLDQDKVEKILSKFDNFLRVAGVTKEAA